MRVRLLLIALAFAGCIGGFVLAVRDIYRVADRACGPAEAGGNCQAIARYYAASDITVFGFFGITLAILLLVSYRKSKGR